MKDFKIDNESKIASGFTIPDGYFDSFSDKVLSRLPQQETKVISIQKSQKLWYYAAAAVIVLMLSVPLYNRYAAPSEDLDSVTLENYITSQSGISQDEIASLLDQDDLDKMKLDLNVDDSAIEEALKSNTNLEEYLLD